MPRQPAANREYMRQYYRQYEQRKRGHRPRVPAQLPLAHVHRCLDADMSRQQIATAAGVAVSTIDRLVRGDSTMVRDQIARRILAVRPRRPVTPIGLTRRVRALAAIGWSVTQIAESAGCNIDTIKDYRKGGGLQVKVSALCIIDAYNSLSMCTPPNRTRYERTSVSGTRNRAARAGWAPPLAWDDESIDDPGATPDLGEAERGFDIDEWLMLVRCGVDPATASERCGVTLNAVQIRAHRGGYTDVLELLELRRKAA